MKNIIVILIFLISGLAMAQTTVTLEDQCNCEVLSGTGVTAAGMTTPVGADIGDIYVNTSTGTIYYWDGGSWELTSSDNQQLQGFTFNPISGELVLTLEDGGTVSVLLPVQTLTTLTLNGNSLEYLDEDNTTNTIPLNVGNLALGTDGNSLIYTDEGGTPTNIPLNVGSLSFAPATRELTYTDEEGTPTIITLPAETLTTITGTSATGNAIGVYESENGALVTINETITSISDAGDGNVTLTNETGASVTVPKSDISDLGNGTYRFTNGDGTDVIIDTNGIDVSNLIAGNRIATVTEADGGSVNINETITDIRGTSTTGNEIGVYEREDGTTVSIQETLTTISDEGDGNVTFTTEAGTVRTVAKANITDNSDGTFTFDNGDGSTVTFVGTDDQNATQIALSPNIDVDGDLVDEATVQDALTDLANSSSDNQDLTGANLNAGNQLVIGIERGSSATADLSALNETVVAGTGAVTVDDDGNGNYTVNSTDPDEDETNELTLVGTGAPAVTPTNSGVTYVDDAAGQLYVYDGTTWNLVGRNTSPDLDPDPTNERNTAFAVNAGNLEITDSGGILSVPVSSLGTDDQNISGSGLSGTDLTIGIENGTNETVDLSSLVGTDDQAISLVGNTLTLEDGGTIDMAPYLDNTDDQAITDFSLDGTTNIITLALENGGTQTIDLSGFLSSDDQQISLAGNTLTLEDGGTVDLSPYLDDTDDQTVTDFNLGTGDILSITLEDGNTRTVDLSSLNNTGTDDQTAAEVNYDNTVSGLAAAEVQSAIDELAAGSTDNQNISGSGLSGTDLTIGIENGTHEIVDLSSLANTDEQDLSSTVVTPDESVEIQITHGNNTTIDIRDADSDVTNELTLIGSGPPAVIPSNNGVTYVDEVAGQLYVYDGAAWNAVGGNASPDLDGDPTNERNTAFAVNADNLEITDSGGTLSVPLSSIDTDDQTITAFSLDNATNVLTITLEDGNTQTVDLSSLDNIGTDNQNLTLTGTDLSIENGSTVDLSGFVSSDDQTISLAGNTMTLEDGGTVDLAPYLDNTDNQAITDFSLDGTTNILTLTLEDGGTQTVDLSGFVSSDDQNLTLTGNTLEIEDGNSVDLSGYLDNTDDQNIENLTLVGNTLTVGIEDGTSQDVDLSSLVGSDDQTITAFSLDNATNELTITLENGNTQTVDLSVLNNTGTDDQNISGSGLTGTDLTIGIENGTNETVDLSSLVGTDDQAISLAGNTLTLEDGGTVDLVPYLDNTDDQEITDFSLDGTTNVLTLTLEDGGTQTIDLSGFVSSDNQNIENLAVNTTTNVLTVGIEDGTSQTIDLSHLDNTGSDDQQISLAGNTLTLEDGGSLDLSPYLDDTDDQTVTDFTLGAGDILSITLEDGNTRTVDLSSLNNTGTDDQTAAEVNYDNTVSGLAAAEVQSALDELAAGSTDDQNISGSGLSGTNLTIGIENGTNEVVDLSSLVGTDDQDLSTDGTVGNISIEDGNSISLNVNDADSDPANEYNTAISTTTGNLEITDNGGTLSTSLISGDANNDIASGTDGALYLNVASVTISETITNLTDTNDGFVTYTNESGATEKVAKANITDNGNGTYTFTNNDGSDMLLDTRASSNPYDNTTSGLTATDTQAALDELSAGSTDDQNLTLSGTDLSIEGGNSIDLSGFVSTDDQTISLAGNTLTLEDGGTVDLSAYLDNTDNQAITDFSLDGTTNILTLTLEDGGSQTVDLSGFVSSDDQQVSLAGNTLTLEDGGTVDLTPYLDNTDDQTATEVAFTPTSRLSSTNTQAAIEEVEADLNQSKIDAANAINANTTAINNHIVADQDTDASNELNTAFAIVNNGTEDVLRITDAAGNLDVPLNDIGSDDQNIESLAVDATTNILTVGIEDGTAQTVDLSHLDNQGTDDQNLTLVGNTLTLEDGGTVDLSSFLDNTDNQTVTSFNLDASKVLTITLEDGNTRTVDLSSLDNSGTDDQNLTLTGTDLSIEGGNSVDLSGFVSTDDQNISGSGLSGTDLTIGIENGTNEVVDLSSLVGTDNQNLTGATLNASNILQIDIEDGTSATVDLSALNDTGTDDQKIDTFTLTGTTLNLSVEDDGEAPRTVNLNSFATDTELAASDAADLDKVIGNEVTNATNATLTRSGSGTTGSPYTLGVSNGGIGTTQLATNAVTNSKIANNAVTTTKILSGGNNKILTTGPTGTVIWQDIPNISDDQMASEVDSNVPVDVDGDGTTETTVEDVIQDIAPITSKAARIFYPPSIAVDASTTGTLRTINLYTQYTAQFATPAVASTGAPAAIPTYAAGDLFYYITYYDTSVFDNVSVDANGVMTYDVINQPADYNSLINVVFVVK